jgi:hypothetical protein
MDPKLRRQVEVRASELIAEEYARRALRRARKRARTNLAKALGLPVEGLAQIEQQSDLLLSAFQESVAAVGGRLSLVAEFPDRIQFVLQGFSGEEVESEPPRRQAERKKISSALLPPSNPNAPTVGEARAVLDPAPQPS